MQIADIAEQINHLLAMLDERTDEVRINQEDGRYGGSGNDPLTYWVQTTATLPDGRVGNSTTDTEVAFIFDKQTDTDAIAARKRGVVEAILNAAKQPHPAQVG